MIDWRQIDTVLLDMDGTLLDLEFDNVLWNQLVPEHYARQHVLSPAQALAELNQHFTRTAHSLQFYCLDHWAELTRLDLLALHRQLRHLIRYRPGAEGFLQRLNHLGGRRLLLVTNAHRDSLRIKDEVTGLTRHLHDTYSAHDFAAPKEAQQFWQQLVREERLDPARTLFIDDTPKVLAAAAEFGIRHLVTVAQPDSAQPPRTDLPHLPLHCFSELMP